MIDPNLIEQIEKKYRKMGENPETYLKGLLHAKPITYWDYVEVETLLSLQKPRTNYKDEHIFIMYHQVTELVLKMMRHEIEQLVFDELNDADWIEKMKRLNRYTGLMINSFDVMKYGMNYDDYNEFRTTLTPASGFQSAQFRYIELYCTRLQNLIHHSEDEPGSGFNSEEDYFERIYWKAAGYNRKTGEKSHTLQEFENKYLKELIKLSKKVRGETLEEKLLAGKPSDALIVELKRFDHLYNVAWPIVHIQTAQHYLDAKGEAKAATGGSEWKKYLHPKYQRRKFFPHLWSADELENWGAEEASE